MAVFFTPTTPKNPEPLPREFHNLRGHCRRNTFCLSHTTVKVHQQILYNVIHFHRGHIGNT